MRIVYRVVSYQTFAKIDPTDLQLQEEELSKEITEYCERRFAAGGPKCEVISVSRNNSTWFVTYKWTGAS